MIVHSYKGRQSFHTIQGQLLFALLISSTANSSHKVQDSAVESLKHETQWNAVPQWAGVEDVILTKTVSPNWHNQFNNSCRFQRLWTSKKIPRKVILNYRPKQPCFLEKPGSWRFRCKVGVVCKRWTFVSGEKKPNKPPKQYKTSNTKPTKQNPSNFARSSQESHAEQSPSLAAWSHPSALSYNWTLLCKALTFGKTQKGPANLASVDPLLLCDPDVRALPFQQVPWWIMASKGLFKKYCIY